MPPTSGRPREPDLIVVPLRDYLQERSPAVVLLLGGGDGPVDCRANIASLLLSRPQRVARRIALRLCWGERLRMCVIAYRKHSIGTCGGTLVLVLT